MFVIEDIHWCDENSLDFLQYFLRHSTSFPWLILLTYRSDEGGPTLSNWLAQQDRERRTQECSLARLTRSDVDAMLVAIFDLDPATHNELLNTLYPLTEGNPFFVEEVLTSLRAAGGISIPMEPGEARNWSACAFRAVLPPLSGSAPLV